MNDNYPQWNGMSKAYEVGMNNHCAYGSFKNESDLGYSKEVSSVEDIDSSDTDS